MVMNTRWREIAVTCWEQRTDGLHFDQEKFAKLIVKECADYVRETYDHEAAESIAWSMEVKYGLHGDYV